MNIKKFITCTILFLIISVAVMSGCSNNNTMYQKSGTYFDTVITITLYGDNADKEIDKCFDMAAEYDNMLSSQNPGSDIYRINHSINIGTDVSDDTLELINRGISYSRGSDGILDITCGYLSNELWHVSDNSDKIIPSSSDINNALANISYDNIDISGNHVTLTGEYSDIDLGAIAKGYIADKMKAMIVADGYSTGVINLGGNVLVIGEKDSADGYYNIGLQRPFDDNGGTPIASVKVKDKSVVTSGNYQRYFTKNGKIYHHIIDLNTGYPCDNDLNSVTIISDKSIDGDALSTITFIKGLDDGIAYISSIENVEAIFITRDNKVICTDGIKKYVHIN